MLIFNCYFCMLFKWHLKITMKSPYRIYYHRQRIYCTIYAKATAKEISNRTLYGWLFFSIPINTQNEVS